MARRRRRCLRRNLQKLYSFCSGSSILVSIWLVGRRVDVIEGQMYEKMKVAEDGGNICRTCAWGSDYESDD